MAELSEVGVSGFSVNSVSIRAGVAKRSISARWDDRESLILDGLNTLSATLAPPRTGTLDGDLAELAVQIMEVAAGPRRAILARCAAEFRQYPQYYEAFRRDSIDRCMAVVEDVLIDARRRGELRRDIEPGLTAESFVSAIVGSQSLSTLDRDAAGLVCAQLVEIFVRGVSAAPPTS